MHDASKGLKSYMLYSDEQCMYLGKADDSVIGSFFCIPRCQIVFVEVDGMQVILCCARAILLEHAVSMFALKFGLKMKAGLTTENEFQQEIF